ncbi:MAG TPA: acylneuraminate cytidylyltransferase family protein [Elusimicrobia bacterium]|nr:MAG: acylneuraminate cytidylyltransferase [Elusimicrobia bacterium GWC2_65_9]OHC66025.1 MAG: acylneuraminate cytidylyltransferase [Rhodocyclales bacterium GWA2_65_19]HAZ07884.1 acylneuraminate cytidylyltransferase family protein [Elusimicrobiota bacterium]
MSRVLAVVPARGGSSGLPGKNIRPFAGLPLIAHSLRCAALTTEITRTVVSTDSEEVAAVARAHGGDVPFLRPAELARPDTPMWPVLRHALAEVEKTEGAPYDFLVLLDPTSPTRTPDEIAEALRRLRARPDAAGIISVSVPPYSPVWHTVVDKDGFMADFVDGGRYHRRQDVPEVFVINGLIDIWRADFVRTSASGWRGRGRHLMLETPAARACSIDTLEEFAAMEALVKASLVPLPWLKETPR